MYNSNYLKKIVHEFERGQEMAYGFRGEKRSGKMMNTHIKFLKINKILSKNLFSTTTYTKI